MTRLVTLADLANMVRRMDFGGPPGLNIDGAALVLEPSEGRTSVEICRQLEAISLRIDELSPLPVIRFLNSVHELEHSLWGDPVSALLIRTIALGQMENRLYDASSLSAALHLPKPTVFRRIARLIKAGLVERRKLGRSNYLVPTADVERVTRERTGEILKLMCRLVTQLQRENGKENGVYDGTPASSPNQHPGATLPN